MNFYFLFLRNEAIDFATYSPEEMQKIMADFEQWNAQMISKGHLIASASLQGGSGKTLRPGNIVADGPYSEAKEAVAGVLLIQAENEAQAMDMATGCPFLTRGGSVELRLAPQFEFEDAAHRVVEEHARLRAGK